MTDQRNWTWAKGPVAGGRAVIFDVDGVIADAWHRQHYFEGSKVDWRGFFEAGEHDPPIKSALAMIDALDPVVAVVLLTARPYYVRDLTLEWLKRHGVRWDLLAMRTKAEYSTSSPVFKGRAVGFLREEGFNIEFAVDDHQPNIDIYNELDVPAVHIPSGYYG